MAARESGLSRIEELRLRMEGNRMNTAELFDDLEAFADEEAATLGIDRAEVLRRVLSHVRPDRTKHIAWHLMHLAVTEEFIFGDGVQQALWEQYKAGSDAVETVPDLETIRNQMAFSRSHLLQALDRLSDDDLLVRPPLLPDCREPYIEIIHELIWHEPYHMIECQRLFDHYRLVRSASQPLHRKAVA